MALFFLFFFWRALFTAKFFVTSDAFIYSYPLRTIAWQELRAGRLPLWTPQLMSGYPLLSMAQIGIGYPLTWFYLLLPGRFAEAIYDLGPYLLFPFFIYCYLREVGRSRLASILAGLAFAYGGFLISPVAYNGLLGNALMWLPLLLIVLERARTRSFIRCLLAATLVYSLSVLTGVGQGFVLAGMIAITYAVFIALAHKRLRNGGASQERDYPPATARGSDKTRWRPLVVMLLAMLFATGVAAFQVLETLRAQRRSIRSHLTFDLFAFSSYRPFEAVKAFLLPLYYHLEACGYVAPLILVLAIVAFVAAIKNAERDWRVFFWTGVAVCGFVFTLGQYTPVFGLLFYLPVFNLFRGAARHAFELTLAISLLSAYGWDATRDFVERLTVKRTTRNRAVVLCISALMLMLAIGLYWLRDMAKIPIGEMEAYYYPPLLGQWHYALWKLLFSLLSVFAIWQAWKLRRSRLALALSLVVIALALFFEPSIMAARWWWPTLKPASRFITASPTTQFLQRYPVTENRVYSYVYPFIEEHAVAPRLEPSNLTMLYGLHDVAGYEPLMLDRYSQALGNAYLDAVRPRPGYQGDATLFDSTSHILDLLNTRFVVSYPYLATEPSPLILRDGIKFNARDLDTTLKPGQSLTLRGVAADADTLALVTATAFSANEPDGTEIAKVRLISTTGNTVETSLRIGIETAEWAHDRPDVRAIVRHSLAPVFSGEPGQTSKYTFLARLLLGSHLAVDHLEILNVSQGASLIINKATLFDSVTRVSLPLPHYDLNKWKPVYDDGGAQILRNERALPRAWLVAEAESVNSDEALQRIRGQGAAFDPRRTALLEVQPGNLPALPGGAMSSSASAKILAYENNSLRIETIADTASVLVVSESNYPGWVATVDGASAPIHTADFLLRGIVLTAGSHRVEMRYTAPAARNGLIISAFTILLIAALGVYEKIRKRQPRINADRRG
jgi:hypothetical protein